MCVLVILKSFQQLVYDRLFKEFAKHRYAYKGAHHKFAARELEKMNAYVSLFSRTRRTAEKTMAAVAPKHVAHSRLCSTRNGVASGASALDE